MVKVDIDKMTISDIDEIMEIEAQSFPVPWTKESFIYEVTSNKLAIYIVAKIDGRVVGYAGMWKVLEEGHITNIAVHPKLRGCKIGTKMVETLIELAKENEIEKLTLEVRESNLHAQKLYKKFGFEILGIRTKYYADNQENALIMWKII